MDFDLNMMMKMCDLNAVIKFTLLIDQTIHRTSRIK